jgi:5-amino-6-(5-phosphoribosylamino)uracil reductase
MSQERQRPYILISTAMSIDGYIDDTTAKRLMLSNDEDFAAVDALRASCDAILIGAGTLRADNPRLMIRSEERRQERLARGLPPSPTKVVIAGNSLDRSAAFFQTGTGDKLVYCPSEREGVLRDVLGDVAKVVGAGGASVDPSLVAADLFARGVRRVLIEGGTKVNTLFLGAGLADELRLALAPFFVGDDRAPRLVGASRFPHDKDRRMTLDHIEKLGDVVVARYLLREGFSSA